MRAAWIRPNGPVPNGPKLRSYGVDTLVYDANDPKISAKFFDEVRDVWKFRPGITRDPNWGDLSADDLALALSENLDDVGSGNKICLVVADIEQMWKRGSAYVLDFLTKWRSLRPTRLTVWTTEPGQGGTVSDELAARINEDRNLIVAPQLYYGPTEWNGWTDMYPAIESAVVLELAQNPERRNIARQRIRCYYDPKNLPKAWDGLVFGGEDLP